MEKTKRYNLCLPSETYFELHDISKIESTSMLEIIKKFINLGIEFYYNVKYENKEIIFRDLKTKEETKILLL